MTTIPEPDYRELVERAGDMMYTLDLEGHFTFINPAGRGCSATSATS
jgi:PAS domain-containing protein